MSESDTNLASMRTRAEALLARYGGKNGPTGHAAVDGSGEPQSLSSFIGGKAKAPRLGKLTGDGRTSSYHESDAVPVQGTPWFGPARIDGQLYGAARARHVP